MHLASWHFLVFEFVWLIPARFFAHNSSLFSVTQLEPKSGSAAAVAYLYFFRAALSSWDLARGWNHAGKCSFVIYRRQIESIMWILREFRLETCMAAWSRSMCVCMPSRLLQSANGGQMKFLKRNQQDKNCILGKWISSFWNTTKQIKVPLLVHRELLKYLITICNFRNRILSSVYGVVPK